MILADFLLPRSGSGRPKCNVMVANLASTEFRKFRKQTISRNFGRFGNFGRRIFQNFTVDSAEVLNDSRTVPLKMYNFADFH